MTLEAGKEMDRRCVLVWLSDVYRNPELAFNLYSDRRQTELAHDALVLLKEQEAEWVDVDDKHDAFDCSNCGAMAGRKCLYCPGCGAKMKNGTRAMESR